MFGNATLNRVELKRILALSSKISGIVLMQANSQVLRQNQTIIPDSVLEALCLREGDAIIFEIDQAGVHLRKAPSIDISYTKGLQGTLCEWDSEFDDEAYADL